jgi:hypothetical protein
MAECPKKFEMYKVINDSDHGVPLSPFPTKELENTSLYFFDPLCALATSQIK